MKTYTERYADAITDVTPHKKELKTDRMSVPAVFHCSDAMMPGDETLAQIESVASNDCLFHHTAAMIDVHSKPGRKNATGTTVVSTDTILPQVNDSDPVCGMRMVRTTLNESNTTPQDIDRLFQALTTRVPTKTLVGTKVPYSVVLDICARGTQALIDHLGIETRNELQNSMSRGNFFGADVPRRRVLDVIPRLFLHVAKYRLGLLGAAGNHFLDMMKVTELLDPAMAAKFNLNIGDYVFLIHTGSGLLGQYTMYMYTPKKREHLSQSLMVTLGRLTFNSQKKRVFRRMNRRIARALKAEKRNPHSPLFTYDGDSLEGRMYMDARAAASNFGVANRATITHIISQTIKDVLGRDPELDLLYDMPHIDIEREEHYGQHTWVHRNGTSRAFGPTRMADHPVFSQTGEPAFVPSSMSTAAFLGCGTDANESSFYSSSHGTGKPRDLDTAAKPKNRTELLRKMDDLGVKLYNAQSSKVVEQDATQYKSVDQAVEDITANNVLHMVAKLQPVAVIMY